MSDRSLSTIDYPITFSGLCINEGMSSTGTRDTTMDKSMFRTTVFDASRLQYRDQREGLHLMSGGDVGTATRVFRFLSLQGFMRDTSPALLDDRAGRLRRAFDLEEAQFTAPNSVGQQALDFYTPTAVPPSGFTSPVHEQYLCRPSVYPQVFDRINTGLQQSWATELICADPTRYMVDVTQATANSGNSWSVAVPNWDETQGAMTFPVVRINTNSGSHSATVSIRMVGTTFGSSSTITVDLSAGTFDGTHTIDIDMRTKVILLDGTIDTLTRTITGGTQRADIRSTAVDTFWGIPANGGTMSVTAGTSNVTSVVATYRMARA